MMFAALEAPGGLAHDTLNDLGHSLLRLADYRYTGIAALLLVGLFCIVKRFNSGGWPTPWECIKVGFSFLAVLGALTFFAVFFMTKPPDCRELSSGDVQLVGIAVFVVAVGSGVGELRSSFARGQSKAVALPVPPAQPNP